jgi:hypothetical protein
MHTVHSSYIALAMATHRSLQLWCTFLRTACDVPVDVCVCDQSGTSFAVYSLSYPALSVLDDHVKPPHLVELYALM